MNLARKNLNRGGESNNLTNQVVVPLEVTYGVAARPGKEELVLGIALWVAIEDRRNMIGMANRSVHVT